MKPRLRSSTLAAFAVGIAFSIPSAPLSAPAAEPAPPGQTFRAAAAAVDITPKQWPVPLIGSFSYRPATAAHDPLHARCLLLDDGETRIAFVVVDSCFVAREYLDRAKNIASKKTGIPTANMLISATHTHTAPPADARYGSEPELAYQKLLVQRIAQSIVQADENLEPAQAGWGAADEPGEVFNRRWFMKPGTIPPDPFGGTTDIVKMNPPRGKNLINPAGPVDPQVSVLSVRTAGGRPLALLANYSLHYVGGIEPQRVSADYYGEFARLMRVRLSRNKPADHFIAILSNGTSGDVNNINFRNPRPPREPFEQIRIVAGKVADAAYRAYENIEHRDRVDLAMVERDITLKRRVPTAHQVARAKTTLKIAGDDEKNLPKRAVPYAERILKLAEMGDTVDVKLQALRIGELGVTAIPFEVLAEIGLEIKERSPLAQTFTIELANGGEGYLPTPAQHKLGGYETWHTTNRVQFDASRIITDALLEMLAEVKASAKTVAAQ